MRNPVLSRRIQRRIDARGQQEGYILLITIGVMLITFLLVVALLGLVFATTGLSSATARMDRLNRATDGALQAAMLELRNDPSAGTDCPTFGNYVSDPTSSDPITLQVTCAANPNYSSPVVPLSGTPAAVYIIGSSYGTVGTVKWKQDCALNPNYDPNSTATPDPNTPNDPTDPNDPGPGCYPWTSNLASTALPTSSSFTPTLLHSGTQPLAFTGDVKALGTAVALRNPKGTTNWQGISTGGSYAQASKGPNGTTGKECGLLSNDPSSNAAGFAAGSVVDTLSGSSANCTADAANILNGAIMYNPAGDWTDAKRASSAVTVPACPGGSTMTLSPGAYDATQTAVLMTRFKNCAGVSVFRFTPGDYWFDVDGSDATNPYQLLFDRANASFIFGSVDAANTKICDTAVDGVSITLSSRTVIKQKRGLVTVCPHKDASGSPKVAIYQERPIDQGTDLVAVGTSVTSGTFRAYQYGQGYWFDNSVVATSDTLSNPARLAANDGSLSSVNFTCNNWTATVLYYNVCGARGTVTIAKWDDEANPGGTISAEPISSAQVVVSGNTNYSNGSFYLGGWNGSSSVQALYNNTTDPACAGVSVCYPVANASNINTRVDVILPDGRNCSVKYPGLPGETRTSWQPTVSYELLNDNFRTPTSDLPSDLTAKNQLCRGLVTDRQVLASAKVRIEFFLNAECAASVWSQFYRGNSGSGEDPLCGPNYSYGMSLDSVKLRTTFDLRAGTVKTPPTDYSAPDSPTGSTVQTAVAAQDNVAADAGQTSCPSQNCAGITRTMALTNFQLASGNPTAALGKVRSASVQVTGSANLHAEARTNNWQLWDNGNGPGSQISVKVDFPNSGGSCTVTQPRLPDEYQTLSVDMFSDTTCATKFRTYTPDQLKTAVVTVKTTMVCRYSKCGGGRRFDTWIDRVSLSVQATDLGDAPLGTHEVTIDEANGNGFRSGGGAYFPTAAVDIHWKGDVATSPAGDTLPLFTGASTFGAIASDMTPTAKMGLVCCATGKAARRQVVVTARLVDSSGTVGRVVGRAVGTFTDYDPATSTSVPGKLLRILRWQLCAMNADDSQSCSA